MAKISDSVKTATHEIFSTDEIFWNNEVQANMRVAKVMLYAAVLMVVCFVLDLVGVFTVAIDVMGSATFQCLLELLVPALICFKVKGERKWVKHMMMILMIIVFSRVDSLLSIYVPLLLAFPVVLSCRYYSRWMTLSVAIFTWVLHILSTIIGVFLGVVDLNILRFRGEPAVTITRSLREVLTQAEIDYMATIQNAMLYFVLPRFMLFGLITFMCIEISYCGRKMILQADHNAKKAARIASELTLARDIQANMLPSIFPPFPDHPEFDVYATMTPAKEVGGDFYDFFMVGKNKVAVVIGDVSGKGVPAALFMVIAKTLIKNHTQTETSPKEVFTTVNNMLCEGNDAGLFVTAWMGVLDFECGQMTYVNAGHNPPLYKKANGEYVFLKSETELILAGMEDYAYGQVDLTMERGDQLFLYTDGASEAKNINGELLGDDRFRSLVNKHADESVDTILFAVKDEIDAFAGDAEQFDDITMLVLRFNTL